MSYYDSYHFLGNNECSMTMVYVKSMEGTRMYTTCKSTGQVFFLHSLARCSWAGLALWSCHHHSGERPTSLCSTDSAFAAFWQMDMSLPSAKTAAKALSVLQICCTFLGWSCTPELSPPSSGSPHVTAFPFTKMAAKALSVLQICWTFLSWSCTLELSPPLKGTPHVTL